MGYEKLIKTLDVMAASDEFVGDSDAIYNSIGFISTERFIIDDESDDEEI